MTLTRVLHEQMKRRVTKQPLSAMQLHALAYIKHHRPAMHDLAERLTITPPSTTTLVHSLVGSSLVRRVTDLADKRSLRLELTPQGTKALQDRLQAVTEGLQEITGVFTPAELKTFTLLMEKLVASSDLTCS